MIITIDGPSGTGKSTVARFVAKELHFVFFNTGSMFRALAWGLHTHTIDATDHPKVIAFLQQHPITVREIDGKLHYFLGDIDASNHLRSSEVSQLASKVSVIEEVRQALKETQQKEAQGINVVFEGRDMGTVVFPNAEVKVFLTAEPEIRAERRFLELITKNPELQATLTLQEVLKEQQERDERDSTRSIAPLKPALDAHIIDTSHTTIEKVVHEIVRLAQAEKNI